MAIITGTQKTEVLSLEVR